MNQKDSPFKFLDSYTKADKDIFFGREKETEEVYSRLFYSNLLLVYGPSGSGKTSLLQCGVANRFGEQNWKPVFIRRKQNIIDALHHELDKQAITPKKAGENITKKLYSLYLDYLMPVYLVLDQFEELFVFGSAVEKKKIVDVLKEILAKREANTHIIISIRE
ncbi:MAG: ATP-binding protein [Bacteroidales bacterium]|nr:ATP-binding protein [Bacteroidales bacterium]